MKKEVFEYLFSLSNEVKTIAAYVESSNENNLKSINRLNDNNKRVKKMFDPMEKKEYLEIIYDNPYINNTHIRKQ